MRLRGRKPRNTRGRSQSSDSRNSNNRSRESNTSSRARDRRDSRDSEGRRSRNRDIRRSNQKSRRRRNYSRDDSNRSRSRLRRNSPNHDVVITATSPLPTGGSINPQPSIESGPTCSEASTLAQALMQAIKTIQPAKSQHYYVSNFDPSVNNIETWCEEVDRAREANGWNDHECLARVASCLKADAKVWFSEWVSNDRTWSNFKNEFKPLCLRQLDYANILFEAMNTTSDKFATYAEYARRTLLRLKIVQGLSDELRTLIVIRGINNPQVRAAAANANLTPESIVSFLSIYTKPTFTKKDRLPSGDFRKQIIKKLTNRSDVKCFTCNRRGHVSRDCRQSKSQLASDTRNMTTKNPSPSDTQPGLSKSCTFCKKPGHTEEVCFTRLRSETRNQRNVNLCSYRPNCSRNSDITSAVVGGVPVDVLIDSGALDVSLISSDALKHITFQPKPKRCVLKGLSDKEVVTDSYVTLTVELSDISIEADLIVVPSSLMSVPLTV
nr:uncharacterized protein LOC113403527 [Vanessa tameamea]